MGTWGEWGGIGEGVGGKGEGGTWISGMRRSLRIDGGAASGGRVAVEQLSVAGVTHADGFGGGRQRHLVV